MEPVRCEAKPSRQALEEGGAPGDTRLLVLPPPGGREGEGTRRLLDYLTPQLEREGEKGPGDGGIIDTPPGGRRHQETVGLLIPLLEAEKKRGPGDGRIT